MRRAGIAVIVLAIAASQGPAGHLEGQVPQELASFDGYVEQAMADWEVPGLAVSVVKDDRVVFARGYGTRTLGKAETVDAETIFAIGSATKGFTTAALGLLVDEGKLDLDDLVIEHLPWFRMWDPWVTAHLTVRDLVTHRSGLPGGRGNLLWYGSTYDRREIARRIRYLEPTASFRAEYQYQNLMFLVAGLVVEAVSGTTWERFVRERILDPMEMDRSVTSVDPLPDLQNVASPHASIEGRWQTVPWRNVDNVAPAGSINSTALDMAQWVRLHLAEGRRGDRRILSEAMTREMGTPQFIVDPDRAGSMNVLNRAGAGINFFTYGLGWQVFDYRGRKVMWHGGNIDGMAAVVAMMPEEELGLVILTNRNGGTVRDALMMRIFDAYTGGPDRDWSRDLLRVEEALDASAGDGDREPAPRPADAAAGTRPITGFEGVYEDRLIGTATVTARDGSLRVQLGTGLACRLEPRPGGPPTSFRMRFDDPGLQAALGALEGGAAWFRRGHDGEPHTLVLAGIGTFRRLESGAGR